MRLWVGTSGFAYKEWKGPFYPEKLPQKGMLEYYASQLPAVEINNTFYRLPNAEMLAKWAEQVPEDFRFSIKASRRITHFKRLKPESAEETGYLMETVATLANRLGVVLFQLPPNAKKDVPRLTAFTELLPEGARAAFEFRHASWFDDDVFALLQDRNFPLVCADVDDPEFEPPLVGGTWGYLRMRRLGYADDELEVWMERIQSQGWDEAFVFFKHEDEGAGPALAKKFLELAS